MHSAKQTSDVKWGAHKKYNIITKQDKTAAKNSNKANLSNKVNDVNALRRSHKTDNHTNT